MPRAHVVLSCLKPRGCDDDMHPIAVTLYKFLFIYLFDSLMKETQLICSSLYVMS